MECRDLPPASAIRQAALAGGGQCRALVMRKTGGQIVAARAAAQNCNTPPQLAADTASTRDRLNHPRYRDFAMIPAAAFFQ